MNKRNEYKVTDKVVIQKQKDGIIEKNLNTEKTTIKSTNNEFVLKNNNGNQENQENYSFKNNNDENLGKQNFNNNKENVNVTQEFQKRQDYQKLQEEQRKKELENNQDYQRKQELENKKEFENKIIEDKKENLSSNGYQNYQDKEDFIEYQKSEKYQEQKVAFEDYQDRQNFEEKNTYNSNFNNTVIDGFETASITAELKTPFQNVPYSNNKTLEQLSQKENGSSDNEFSNIENLSNEEKNNTLINKNINDANTEKFSQNREFKNSESSQIIENFSLEKNRESNGNKENLTKKAIKNFNKENSGSDNIYEEFNAKEKTEKNIDSKNENFSLKDNNSSFNLKENDNQNDNLKNSNSNENFSLKDNNSSFNLKENDNQNDNLKDSNSNENFSLKDNNSSFNLKENDNQNDNLKDSNSNENFSLKDDKENNSTEKKKLKHEKLEKKATKLNNKLNKAYEKQEIKKNKSNKKEKQDSTSNDSDAEKQDNKNKKNITEKQTKLKIKRSLGRRVVLLGVGTASKITGATLQKVSLMVHNEVSRHEEHNVGIKAGHIVQKEAEKVSSKLVHHTKKVTKHILKEKKINKSVLRASVITPVVSLPKTVIKDLNSRVSSGVHNQISKYEDENSGVKAFHIIERQGEKLGNKLVHSSKNGVSNIIDPKKRLARLEKKSLKANIKATKSRLKFETRGKKNKLSLKELQKRFNKKKFTKMYRDSENAGKVLKNGAKLTEKALKALEVMAKNLARIASTMARILIANAYYIGIAFLVFIVFYAMFYTANTAMLALSKCFAGTVGTTITASNSDVANTTSHWTDLTSTLKKDIDDTPENFPGYDEYRYNVPSIGDDPFKIISFLSAMYKDFKSVDVNPILDTIFQQEYVITRTPSQEVRIGHNSDGSSYTYIVTILTTTLTVTPFENVVTPILSQNNCLGLYQAYIQSKGSSQGFGSPVAFEWYNYVSRLYGYSQVIAKPGMTADEKKQIEFNKGIDITCDKGTPIKAVMGGTVISASTDSYGLDVVTVLDDNGYKENYEFLDTIYFNPGQKINYGDVVGLVGDVQDELGTRVHIEVLYNGESLNPLFVLETGRGYITDYSQAPPQACSGLDFGKIEDEAKKFLGYPYCWGGTTPQTSFDCSGYVEYVYRNSIGLNLPRTAQEQFDYSTPVSPTDAQPGDLVFFTGTYDTVSKVTHVGIYAGNGKMYEAGDPIKETNLNNPYWVSHFYSFGRVINK